VSVASIEEQHKAALDTVRDHAEGLEDGGKTTKENLANALAADERNPLDIAGAIELLNQIGDGVNDELEKAQLLEFLKGFEKPAPAEGEESAADAAPAEGEEAAAPAEGEESAAPAEVEESAAPAEGEEAAAVTAPAVAAPAVEGEAAPAVEGEAAPAVEGEASASAEAETKPAEGEEVAAAEGEAVKTEVAEKPAEEENKEIPADSYA